MNNNSANKITVSNEAHLYLDYVMNRGKLPNLGFRKSTNDSWESNQKKFPNVLLFGLHCGLEESMNFFSSNTRRNMITPLWLSRRICLLEICGLKRRKKRKFARIIRLNKNKKMTIYSLCRKKNDIKYIEQAESKNIILFLTWGCFLKKCYTKSWLLQAHVVVLII